MRILGIIPARAGSKRVPGKNMRKIGGKPLVTRALESALESKMLNEIVVSSDSDEVLSLSNKYPDERLHFIRRPDEISKDDSPAIDYINHTLAALEAQKVIFDIIVIIQPSSPFTEPEDIDKTIGLLKETGADSAVSVVKLPHDLNPAKMKVMDGDKLKPYIEEEKGRMESGSLPEIYVRNCSVYASKISVIKEGEIIGDDCRGYIMPRNRSVDINDEFDFQFAEFLEKKSSERNI